MLFAELVHVSDAVASTGARSEKASLLAGLLAAAEPDEVPIVVGLLSGEPRQGRIGVGWATVASLDAEPASTPTLTVRDVDDVLDDVAALHGSGSQAERVRALSDALGRATAAESDFLRRLLVGELRQGANAGVVTDAVAKALDVPVSVLRRSVMLSGDLGHAAEVAAREGRAGLEAIGLRVMRPIQPMLASTSGSAAEALAELGRSSVEWKLDGIRVQVHRDGDVVRVWTRNLNEITDGVRGVCDVVRSFDADTLVLDGEILGVDETGRPLAFQDTASAGTVVTPFFFDILHRDGEDLLDRPLADRRPLLLDLVGDHGVPGIVTDDAPEAEAVFATAIDRGHEGIVVKAADSTYQAGRRGKSWRKVKPVHTLDLVVLAVEYGSGRRRGRLSNIHLGARDPRDGSFVMVGKTFKGMTDEMLVWQTERFRELAIADDGRVVTVRPVQVVEIALDGVQRSTRYRGGVALRFARVVRYRDDKDAQDVDTIDAVRALG